MTQDREPRFDLTSRVALVTGAGQGVGRRIAQVLAAHGARIVVNDVDGPRARAGVADICGEGGHATAMIADVTDLAQVQAGIRRAEAELGPISILVNNAGNFGRGQNPERHQAFWQTDPARWRRYIDVNLYGVMNCCFAVLPGMVERGYGRIVTIVSDAARHLERGGADYAAAKAGAAGFTRGVAADAARHGVTANCISLATILPEAPAEELDRFLASGSAEKQLSRYAIRRFGQADDIAGTALLLCSDAAPWTTGQTYPVNGGYTASL